MKLPKGDWLSTILHLAAPGLQCDGNLFDGGMKHLQICMFDSDFSTYNKFKFNIVKVKNVKLRKLEKFKKWLLCGHNLFYQIFKVLEIIPLYLVGVKQTLHIQGNGNGETQWYMLWHSYTTNITLKLLSFVNFDQWMGAEHCVCWLK